MYKTFHLQCNRPEIGVLSVSQAGRMSFLHVHVVISDRPSLEMSGPLDLSLLISALIWYLSGYKADLAIFWFAIIYSIGHTIAANPESLLLSGGL